MDFALTQEQQALQDSVRRFCHAWLSDRQGDRLDEIPQSFDLWAVQLIVA